MSVYDYIGTRSKDCQREYKGFSFRYTTDWTIADGPVLHVLAFKDGKSQRAWTQRAIHKEEEMQGVFTLQELHDIWEADLLQHESIVKVIEHMIDIIKQDIDKAEEK